MFVKMSGRNFEVIIKIGVGVVMQVQEDFYLILFMFVNHLYFLCFRS